MAASAYNRYATAPAYAPKRKTQDNSRPDVHVVSGGKVTKASFAPRVSTAIIVAAVSLVLVFTALTFARITIASATVATSVREQVLSEQLDTARSAGNDLEVALTTKSYAADVKKRAQALGFAAATDYEVITLKQDVVAFDASGNILLSESIKRASSLS